MRRTASGLPPIEEEDYNENVLRSRGRWLDGHGWMVCGEEGGSEGGGSDNHDMYVYHGYGADHDDDTRERRDARHRAADALLDGLVSDLMGELVGEVMAEVLEPLTALSVLQQQYEQLGLRQGRGVTTGDGVGLGDIRNPVQGRFKKPVRMLYPDPINQKVRLAWCT